MRPVDSIGMTAPTRDRWAVPGTAVAAVAIMMAAAVGVPMLRQAAESTSPSVSTDDAASGSGQRWVAGWAPSPVVGSAIPWSDCPAGKGLENQTVRNVAFVSAGGSAVRIRVTNTFGQQALRVGRVTVAVQAADANAVSGTMRQVTFNGRTEVTVAAGARALSDPVRLSVAPLTSLLVSVYVPEATGPVTNHPFTAQGNFLTTGDRALAGTADGYGNTPCWMLVDGVDVRAPQRVVGSVVALGDSITDTANTTGNANRRWPDYLARRLNARSGKTLSVVNAGLGGNRLLAPRDGEPYWGIPALARLERDVFTQTGVRAVILLEGTNDIGYSAPAADIIAGYQQLIVQTHAQGLPIFGGTVPPMGGSFMDTPERRGIWAEVNEWIRTSGEFDGVVDFAKVLGSADDPMTLDPGYDSGDHLHPNDAGCEAMANAVNLSALTR